MQDIADDLGIQPPSLYNYVKSKRKILDMVCLGTINGGHAALLSGTQVSADVTVQVRRGVEEQVRFRLTNPYGIAVLTRETFNLSLDVRTKVIAIRDEQRQVWFELVSRGVEEGVFDSPNIRMSCLILQDMCGWLQVGHFHDATDVTHSQLSYWYGELAIRMLTGGLTPTEAGRP